MELRTKPRRRRRRGDGPGCLIIIAAMLIGGLIYFAFDNRDELAANILPAPTSTPTQSPANLAFRAQLYVRDGEYDNAIASYEAAIDIDPGRVDYYTALIDLLVRVGKPARALELADQALEIEPDNDELLEVKAAAHLRNGDRLASNSLDPDTEYARAVEAGRAATRLNPDNWRSHAYIAAGLVRQDIELAPQALDSADESLNRMERALREQEIAFADKVVLFHYAEVQTALGFYDTAQERLQQAYDIDNNYIDARLALARIYFFFRKNNAGGIDLLETALEDNPDNADLYATLSYFQIIAGNYAEAERYARQAAEIDTELVRAHAFLGWAYFKNSNFPLAIDALRVATERYGSPNADTSFYFALLGLALYFEDTANCTEAVPILQSALDVSAPGSPGEINAQVGLDDCRSFELNQG